MKNRWIYSDKKQKMNRAFPAGTQIKVMMQFHVNKSYHDAVVIGCGYVTLCGLSHLLLVVQTGEEYYLASEVEDEDGTHHLFCSIPKHTAMGLIQCTQ